MLSWSLVVCTLNRRAILEEALSTAICQTRLPKQIIVVDASTDWQDSKSHILSTLATQAPTIEWIYINSPRRSLAYQRNIGFELCHSEIVFFFDDDSFLYPTCADEIMQVYEQDVEAKIGGVSAILAENSPDQIEDDFSCTNPQPPSHKNQFILKDLLTRFHELWYMEKLFIPYDGRYHNYSISTKVQVGALADAVLMHGCRMTYRAEAFRQVGGCDPILVGSCMSEDADVSYRVSQRYPLVLCTKARLFHAQTPIARSSRRRNILMVLLNNISLFLLNTKQHKLGAIATVWRYIVIRTFLEFLRDSFKPQRGFPHFRGALQATCKLPEITQLYIRGKLAERYLKIQENLLQS